MASVGGGGGRTYERIAHDPAVQEGSPRDSVGFRSTFCEDQTWLI